MLEKLLIVLIDAFEYSKGIEISFISDSFFNVKGNKTR